MGNKPGNQGHSHGLFGGQQITQYGGPANYPPPYNPGPGNYPPQGYPPPGYPPPGYPPPGFHPGYPQGQYPGYGPGYPQQGYPGGPYQRPGTPVAAMGQAACCGSCTACLTCLLCSCSPCIMGAAGDGRGMSDEDEDGHPAAEANVSSPHDDEHH